jgi:pimeloyl-ACP methyl ester carboxylesterase
MAKNVVTIPVVTAGIETPNDVVLLHGVMGSARMWVEVEHVLKGAAHIHVPTALGHRGG